MSDNHVETHSLIIPSDSESRKALLGFVKEIDVQLTLIDAAKDHIKAILDHVKIESTIPSKYVKKCATVYHKQNFVEERSEAEDFAVLFETLFSNPSTET